MGTRFTHCLSSGGREGPQGVVGHRRALDGPSSRSLGVSGRRKDQGPLGRRQGSAEGSTQICIKRGEAGPPLLHSLFAFNGNVGLEEAHN